jgi:hypothetical protein
VYCCPKMGLGKYVSEVKLPLSLCLIKHHDMTTYGGVEVYLHAFLTSALYEGEGFTF